MNAADMLKCMDLVEQLGIILGVNPIWKDDYVSYSVGLDDDYIELSLDLDDGSWGITTGDHGFILPKEASELMADMSNLVEGEEDDLGEKHNDEMD